MDETADNSDALDQGPPQPPQAVQVTSNRLNPAPAYHGLSPFWSGLLYGAGAGAVAGGPIGALVGAGVGTVRYLQTRNALDMQARQIHDVIGESQGLQRQIMDMMPNADPITQKMLMQQLRLQNEGMTEFINEGNPEGRAKMDRANTALASIYINQLQYAHENANAQATAQRQLISGEATNLRNQYSATQDTYTGVETQANKVLSIATDPDFNPNKPLYKGLLVQMISEGIGGLYRENPSDYMSAISQGVGAFSNMPGKLGAVAQTAAGLAGAYGDYIKSEDFKVSKEDYIRLAINMKGYAEKQAAQKFGLLGQQAATLNDTAHKWGVFDENTDLQGFINGGQSKLAITPTPELPPLPTVGQLVPSQANANRPRSLNMAPRGVLQFNRVQSLQNRTAVQNQDLGLSEAQPRPVN